MIIAIDGTLASGKGTIARRLAATYQLPHLDTGKLYRATGIAAVRAGLDLSDDRAIAKLAANLDLSAFDDHDLRTAEAGATASKVAAHTAVRSALLQLQRDFAHQEGGAVLDGRDIGTVVCPEADIKLWVDADVTERARRRCAELETLGQPISLEDMTVQLHERDTRDKTRKAAPMKRAEDAVLINTTDLDIDAAVERALAVIEAVLNA